MFQQTFLSMSRTQSISPGTYAHCHLWRRQWWIWERFRRKNFCLSKETETSLKLSRNGKNRVYLWLFFQPLFCLVWKVWRKDHILNKTSGNVTLNRKTGSPHRILGILNGGRSPVNKITQLLHYMTKFRTHLFCFWPAQLREWYSDSIWFS